MKKISLTLFAIFAMIQFSFAQWNPGLGNTFYYTTTPLNIGGTTQPLGAANLQVTGNALFGGANTSPGSGFNTSFLVNTKLMLIGWNRSGGGGETDFIANQGAGSLGGFSFYNHDNNNNENLLMNISGNGTIGINGNLGIGTNSPAGKLSIMVGANEDRQLDFSLIGTSLPAAQRHAYIGLTDGGGTAPFDVVGDLYIAPRTSLARAIRFVTFNGTAVAERMMLDNSGNLGIGTPDTKGYKLAVNGNVVANGITVKMYPWADYVFKPSYHLPSLTEVKAYIDLNQHLPEIPSAEQIAKEGQNLGEINRLLLKKVEELTLYLIENDKKDKERDAKKDAQLSALKQKVAALAIRLDAHTPKK